MVALHQNRREKIQARSRPWPERGGTRPQLSVRPLLREGLERRTETGERGLQLRCGAVCGQCAIPGAAGESFCGDFPSAATRRCVHHELQQPHVL